MYVVWLLSRIACLIIFVLIVAVCEVFALIRLTQGGVRKFAYPKYVWSPAGGWWCNPRHWKRNTFFAFVGIGIVSAFSAYASSRLEVIIGETGLRPKWNK